MNDIQTIQNKISDTSGEIVMYQPDETIRLEVRLGEDTVWLTQQQIAELFMSSRTNIVEHIQHIYSEKELEEISTCRNFRQVRQEGKRMVTRDIPMYNLDMIISVGYRINSKRGTLFRQWANKVLKDYLLKGYSATALRNMRKFYENWSALDCNSASTLADISSVATDKFKSTIVIVEINSEKSFAVTSAPAMLTEHLSGTLSYTYLHHRLRVRQRLEDENKKSTFFHTPASCEGRRVLKLELNKNKIYGKV